MLNVCCMHCRDSGLVHAEKTWKPCPHCLRGKRLQRIEQQTALIFFLFGAAVVALIMGIGYFITN